MEARALRPDEFEVWRVLRLEALRLFPNAFLTTVEEAEAMPIGMLKDRLSAGNTFAVFDDAPLGIGALIPQRYAMTAHRADIGAFYVTPHAQGSGAADRLMEALHSHASTKGCWQTELHVAESNSRARAFYIRHGYREMGRTPNATFADGIARSDLFMVRTGLQ